MVSLKSCFDPGKILTLNYVSFTYNHYVDFHPFMVADGTVIYYEIWFSVKRTRFQSSAQDKTNIMTLKDS